MTLRMTEQMLRQHQAKHGKNNCIHPHKGGKLERLSDNEFQEKTQIQKALPPVDIVLTHYRKRYLDVDNFCTKWFIDGFVKAGLLHDDSPKYVRKITHQQVKIEQWETERIDIEFIIISEKTI